MSARFWNTQHGFVWGAATVTRVFSIDGRVCLRIATAGKEVTVYVSRTGRSLRVFDGKCHELKVTP